MPDTQVSSGSRRMLWAGYILSALPILGLLMSAVFKFMNPPDVVKEFVRLGYTESHALGLGILEVACTVLYLLPQTSVFGAILLTGYLGGATATHVRIDDPLSNLMPPIVMGVLVWLGLYLREPRLRALIPLRSRAESAKLDSPGRKPR